MAIYITTTTRSLMSYKFRSIDVDEVSCELIIAKFSLQWPWCPIQTVLPNNRLFTTINFVVWKREAI